MNTEMTQLDFIVKTIYIFIGLLPIIVFCLAVRSADKKNRRMLHEAAKKTGKPYVVIDKNSKPYFVVNKY